MEEWQTSVGVMAIGPRDLGAIVTETVGSSVLFGIASYFCIVSCRHVVEPRLGQDQFKAIFKYTDGAGGLKRAVLGLDERMLKFHPDDTGTTSYDVAAFWAHRGNHNPLPFPYLELQPHQYYPQRVLDLKLQVLGYRMADITSDAVLSDGVPLPLRSIEARLIDAPHIGGKATNFSKSHIAQHVAEIETDEDLSGMSGALVLAEERGANYPVGMVVSSGKGRVQNRLSRTEHHVNFVGFVDFPTILVTLQ